MIYIGIDPSLTGTGIVVLDDQGNVLDKACVKTKAGVRIEDRFQEIIFGIWEMIHLYQASHTLKVFIEGLSFGSKSASMLELAGLHYFLRHYLLHTLHAGFSVIPPQSLKKWVCGKGNVKKEQMLLQTYKRWGLEFQDNNICDAYCLARYAMEHDAIS